MEVAIIVNTTDPDGDNLTITYSHPFNETGMWVSSKGDAGNYTFTLSVSDGINIVDENFQLQVLPQFANESQPKLKQDENQRYLIKFKGEINSQKLEKLEIKKTFSRFGIVKVDAKAEDILSLQNDPEIEHIEEDQTVTLLSDSIPYGVNRTGAPLVWNITNGSNVKLALLDSGISPHNDIIIAGGISIIGGNFTDEYGHGTAVAGVVASILNNEGLVGVAPSVGIYSVKIIQNSSGNLSDAIEGLEWAINNSMDIVLLSFGMETYSVIFREVLENAYQDGILLIAPAGNNGGEVLYPAAYRDVIAVGSVDQNDTRVGSSSYGTELELMGVGVDVNTNTLNNSYATYGGTSMAASHVAGVAALLKSYNISLNNEEIRAKLRNDAIDLGQAGWDEYYGYGLVWVNLTSQNFTFINNTYFYEVYNITEFINITNYTSVFWLNGTGTIDDVNFTEGYYLVIKYFNPPLNMTIYVSENGTIFLLNPSTLDLDDDYHTYGGGTDNTVWVGGSVDFECTECSAKQVACFAYDSYEEYPPYFEYSECWALSATAESLCLAVVDGYYDFCSSYPSKCHDTGIAQEHDYPSSLLDTKGKNIVGLEVYYNCGDVSYDLDIDYQNLSIIDALNSSCVDSGTWRVKGRYGIANWKIIYPDMSCGSRVCDPSVAGYVATSETYNYETSDNGDHYPCRVPQGGFCSDYNDCYTGLECIDGICTNTSQGGGPPLCNGTIEVNTEDSSGSPLQWLSVYLNSIYNGSTNEIGQKIINLYNVECDANQEVKVKCTDNSTLCGIKTTQIDFNGDIDYLNFDCTMCSTTDDLYISQSDVYVNTETNIIKATVHSTGITANVKVALYREDKNGIIQEVLNDTISITAGSEKNATFNLQSLEGEDFLHIYVDSDNSITNEVETNNYIFRAALKPVKAYLDVSIDPSFDNATSAIREYIASFVDEVSTTNNADVIIIVGHPFFSGSEPFTFGDEIIADGRAITKVYGGIVKSGPYFDNPYQSSNKPQVLAYGNRIEGDIAAVKRIINARNIFLNPNALGQMYESYIDDYDTLGISVMDLMHNSESETYFTQNNEGFTNVVKKILFDNNFEVAVKPVKTLNTTSYGESTILRVKNVNSDFSADYIDAVGISDKPVVMSSGIWSNLFSFDEFGRFISENGRDVWLIELTGGPENDCPTCPNYNFNDLIDYYWPASVAGIQEYSGKNQVDYIGFSNGCRIGISSLETHSQGANNVGYYFDYQSGQYLYSDLASDPVDYFMGMACPGNFSGNSLLVDCWKEYGGVAIDYLNNHEIFHPTQHEFTSTIARFAPITSSCYYLKFILKSDGRISLNLAEDYYNLMLNDSDPQPGKNVNLSKYIGIYGDNGYAYDNDNDYFVSIEDQFGILNSVTAQTKVNYSRHLRHNQIPDDNNIHNFVMEELLK